jgi:hypothetical protein
MCILHRWFYFGRQSGIAPAVLQNVMQEMSPTASFTCISFWCSGKPDFYAEVQGIGISLPITSFLF